MSHYSPSYRQSEVLTSSPLRRKSMLNLSNSDASLRQNDDDAERMERRRNAQIEMCRHDASTPGSSRQKSMGGMIAGLSAAQLGEHYASCIKLSAENVSLLLW
ncbi:Condensin complex subunit 2 [Zootermopsis nevadensis]|uniref:Condensin complex subunit 2 n=1 Tax=Zootermopsis nevadensis TaxID=136037 RepID=A0A067QRW1_ZOONE|nr:Condensin complex subunit 2 [Zootermopsis nevadensis]